MTARLNHTVLALALAGAGAIPKGIIFISSGQISAKGIAPRWNSGHNVLSHYARVNPHPPPQEMRLNFK